MTAFLKAEKLLVVLASEPSLFHSLAPLNEKLFCPKDLRLCVHSCVFVYIYTNIYHSMLFHLLVYTDTHQKRIILNPLSLNFITGLQATLLVRHPITGKLYVNYDPKIAELMRETDCMLKMGIKVPRSTQTLFLRRFNFKHVEATLKVFLFFVLSGFHDNCFRIAQDEFQMVKN